MPKPTKKPAAPQQKSPAQVEIVDPRWLLRTLGVLVLAAFLCGYLALGLLFYLGSWQLVLKPTHNGAKGLGLPAETIRFNGKPGEEVPLNGQWLPATGTTRESYAVLYLRGADGQLDAADGTQIATLQSRGLNVLAFDYRGYGANPAQPHPSERRMLQDAVTAWTYLTTVRKVAPDHVVVFGSGVGLSLAAQLLEREKGAGALIGYNADPDVLARAQRDPRSKLFPLRLVFHDRFALDALTRLQTPKLLYSTGPADGRRSDVYRASADPKITVEVPTHGGREEEDALARFLDQYLPAGLQQLRPAP